MGEVQHFRVTYNNIHNLIRAATPKVAAEFNPDLLVAIGMYSFRTVLLVVNAFP